MGPTGDRHVSNSINACLLMYNWTVNHGVIWTIAMNIVFVGLRIGRRLMFMI